MEFFYFQVYLIIFCNIQGKGYCSWTTIKASNQRKWSCYCNSIISSFCSLWDPESWTSCKLGHLEAQQSCWTLCSISSKAFQCSIWRPLWCTSSTCIMGTGCSISQSLFIHQSCSCSMEQLLNVSFYCS